MKNNTKLLVLALASATTTVSFAQTSTPSITLESLDAKINTKADKTAVTALETKLKNKIKDKVSKSQMRRFEQEVGTALHNIESESANNTGAVVGLQNKVTALTTKVDTLKHLQSVSADDDVVVAGGDSNTATGVNATVVNGWGNTAQGNHATVVSGDSNKATADKTVIVGGKGNKAEAGYAIVVGGEENKATKKQAIVGGGYKNERLENSQQY